MTPLTPTPWTGAGQGPAQDGPAGPSTPPSKKPGYFKSESIKNVHSDSRPRGYLPAGGGKR